MMTTDEHMKIMMKNEHDVEVMMKCQFDISTSDELKKKVLACFGWFCRISKKRKLRKLTDEI